MGPEQVAAAMSEALAAARGSLDSEVIEYVVDLASSVIEDPQDTANEVYSFPVVVPS